MVELVQLIHDGKTKTLYARGDDQVAIVFKDDVTGTADTVDPGGDVVVGQIEGKGDASLRQSIYFFELLEREGMPTHYVGADVTRRMLYARRAHWFGLEFIVRFSAVGSFLRRYGRYATEGAPLGGLVEITVKDDERGDPLIVSEAVTALGIMTPQQVEEAVALVRRAAMVMKDDLKTKGFQLLDIKFECGVVDDRIVLIDDISTDNMRLVRDGKTVEPAELTVMLDG